MCDLTITGVLGIESVVGNGPDELRVRGTADDCTEVCVQIVQTDPVDWVTPEKTAAVDAAGNWTATFSVTAGDFAPGDFLCGGGNKAVVMAYCCQDSNCDSQFDFEALPCGECPVVAAVQAEVSTECNPDGTRSVTVSCAVTPGDSGFAVIQVLNDDGLGPPAETVDTPNTTIAEILNYQPGQHSATIAVIFPQGCSSTVVDFAVPECEAPAPCPEIEIVTDQSGCDEQGRRSLEIRAQVFLESGNPVAATLAEVDANDNPIGPPLDQGTDPGGELLLTASGLFQAGTTPRFRVDVTEPANCPGATVGVDVPPCDDEDEPVVVPPDEDDEEPPVNGQDQDTGCPWWWLLPAGLVLLIAGVAMTVLGACTINTPLIIAGGIAGGLALVPLTAWAYACQDCPTMRTLLLTGVGVFDVLAVVALALNASSPACAVGFLSGALLVATAVFALAVPYMLLCVTGCQPLRVALGVLAGIYAALLLAALVLAIVGLVEVTAVLVVIAAIVAAIALNLVLAPMLVMCD